MNTPGIPDYADERAAKFFRRVFIGKNPGNKADENGYLMSWDSRHEDLEASKTHGSNYCAYCGNRPYPIQTSSRGYDVTGHMCICADAINEVEINRSIEKLKNEHISEIHKLKMSKPKACDDVKRKILESHISRDSYYLDKMLKSVL